MKSPQPTTTPTPTQPDRDSRTCDEVTRTGTVDQAIHRLIEANYVPKPLDPNQRVALEHALWERIESKKRSPWLLPGLAAGLATAALAFLLLPDRTTQPAPSMTASVTASTTSSAKKAVGTSVKAGAKVQPTQRLLASADEPASAEMDLTLLASLDAGLPGTSSATARLPADYAAIADAFLTF